jgi:hypothetical protein
MVAVLFEDESTAQKKIDTLLAAASVHLAGT